MSDSAVCCDVHVCRPLCIDQYCFGLLPLTFSRRELRDPYFEDNILVFSAAMCEWFSPSLKASPLEVRASSPQGLRLTVPEVLVGGVAVQACKAPLESMVDPVLCA